MTLWVTGGGGWIGRAMLDAVADARGVPRGTVPPLVRGDRLLHCAWPDLPTSGDAGAGAGWDAFLSWSLALHGATIAAGGRFVGIGSGIETLAGGTLAGGYAAYALHKAALRDSLIAAHPATGWARLHFRFGAGERAGRLVPAAIRAARAGERFVTGPLDRRRHWSALPDAVAGLIAFVASDAAGDWDLCGADDIAFADLFAMIGDAAGRPLTLDVRIDAGADAAIARVPAPRRWPGLSDSHGAIAARLQSYAARL